MQFPLSGKTCGFVRNLLAIVLLVVILSLDSASGQTTTPNLVGSFPPNGGPITVSTIASPIKTDWIEFYPNRGSIRQGESPAPFDRFIENGTRVGVRSSDAVTIDGAVTLDIMASADAKLTGSWLDDSNSRWRNFFSLGGESLRDSLVAQFPYDGGPITVQPPVPQIPLAVNELEFRFPSNTVTGGDNAAPFATIDRNFPNLWRVSSEAEVIIDGPITLDLHVPRPIGSVPAIHGRLFSDKLGDGNFEVERLPAPATDLLRGTYSHQGPVVLETASGPVSLRQIDLQSLWSNHAIITSGDPAPFETLQHNGTDGRWTASSNANVTLDGSIQLDAQCSVSSSSGIRGWMRDETGMSYRFPMQQRGGLFASADYPVDGGSVRVFSTSPVVSINIHDENGTLQGGGDAGLFQTLTSNTDSSWRVDSLRPVSLQQEPSGGTTLDLVVSRETNSTATFFNGLDTTTVSIQPARVLVPPCRHYR